MQPTLKVGDAVTRPAFFDCFGKHVGEARGLTVDKVTLEQGLSIPDYYRIETSGPGWTKIVAAERFFCRRFPS